MAKIIYPKVKKSGLYLLFSVILMSILPACRNTSPANQGVFTPIRPDFTPTPVTDVPPDHQPTSTSVVSDLVSPRSYTHPTNRFSINHPENWRIFDRTDGVVFIEPSDRAGYSVFFSDVGQIYSDQELNQYLVTFVAENFVDEGSNFSAISQEQKADGSIEAQFVANDPNLGKALNEVRVIQVDTIVFVLLISATEEQWKISQNKLQALADTFTPLDTTPLVTTEPTNEPPVWLLIGPTSNEFGFFYPSNWEILRQDESVVSVAMPESEIVFQARTLDVPKAEEDPTAAEKAALAYLANLSEKYEAVQNLPPTEFPLDTTTGTTIDFLYTSEGDVEMAGSVITTASNGKIYQVVFTAPAEFYEVALQWFNPMYQSFKILSPDELIQ